MVKIVRGVGGSAAVESGRRVQNQIFRICALIDSRGVDKRFERGSRLTLRLGGAIEF